MIWNYRVLKKADGSYGFIEVYYNEDGIITSYSEDFMHPYGESERDLEDDLEKMASALNKPTLLEIDLPN